MSRLPKLIVVVRVTTDCPLRCKFCGFSRDLGYPRAVIDSARLLRFGEVLSSYQVISNRHVLVSWLGGEPYRWPRLMGDSRAFRRFNLPLGITTNGIMLASPRIRRQTIELFRQVTISVDGLPRQHDPCSFTIDEYSVPLEAVSSPHELAELRLVFRRRRMNQPAKACGDCHAGHVFEKFQAG